MAVYNYHLLGKLNNFNKKKYSHSEQFKDYDVKEYIKFETWDFSLY